jgi:hypothetical protein
VKSAKKAPKPMTTAYPTACASTGFPPKKLSSRVQTPFTTE